MQRWPSYALLGFQLGFVLLLGMTTSQNSWITVTFTLIAAAMMLWGLFSLRHQLSALPEPKKGAPLIQQGPFRWVRHPVYTGLILWGLGQVLGSLQVHALVFFVGLFITLLFKIQREERLLTAEHADYSDYKKRTKALVPFVF